MNQLFFYVIYFTQHDVNDLHFYEHLHVKKSFLKHEFTAIYLLFWLWNFLSKFICRCWSLYKPHMEIHFHVCFVCGGMKMHLEWRMNFMWRGGVKCDKFKLQICFFPSLFCHMINWNNLLWLFIILM